MKIQFAKNCKLTVVKPPSYLTHKQNSMCEDTCTNIPRYMNIKLVQKRGKHTLYPKNISIIRLLFFLIQLFYICPRILYMYTIHSDKCHSYSF